MAAVAEMGEVDEIHSNEEGIVLNGDITKDIDMKNKDVEMESEDVEMDSVTITKIPREVTNCKEISMDGKEVSMDVKDVSTDSKDVSMDSKDGDMEDEETGSQSAVDEDSQDSHDSQEGKSQGSIESQDQDSNMESEQVNEENGISRDENEDTNTNSSLPQNEVVNNENNSVPRTEEINENSTASSKINDDEDSRSSTEDNNESKAEEQDPLFNENSADIPEQSDTKTQPDNQDQEVSQDGSESKSESAKMDLAENGTQERAPSAASSTLSVHEIHEIDDDDKIKAHETIELNESDDDGDVMIVDGPKTNGTTEIIDLIDITPEKKVKEKKEKGKESVTPRRSSRNLNKSKSYVESDKEDTPPPPPVQEQVEEEESEESDIEEIMPQDPLAVNDQITVERIPSTKKVTAAETSATIVVKDTKRLVEIANKSNQNTISTTPQQGKKEPTLVIIDTNSILSGRGPVPVPIPKPTQAVTVSTANFNSMLPVAVPAQGMYPANMRATITPIPVNTISVTPKNSPIMASMQTAVAPLLPTLTDDMFVVEAPSFIVPYVYEKPPVKVLKEFVADIKKQIQENKAQEKKERHEKREKDKKEDKKKGDEDDTDVSFSSGDESEEEKTEIVPKKPYSYFDSPLGKFFIDIGMNMVQEYVQTDLLKQQKRKRDREQGSNPETNKTIASLMKNIEMSKENNEHFKMAIKKCEFCNFKTESKLAMAYHLETPHMKNFVYKCNFCPYEVRSPHDILFHMEAEHAVRGHLERAPAFHQCPSCPFEDNQKGKLSRHLVVCARKFKPDRNLEPPPDWEPPAKIPRMPKMRATGLNATVAAYQTLAANKGAQQYQFLSKMQLQANAANSALNRGRGRPTLGPNVKTQPIIRPQGMIFKQQTGGQVLVPANYQLGGNQVFQTTQTQQQTVKKPANTPSISITPLPRGTTASPAMASKPGDTNSKNSFVICEICDGYIKDLEQLRNHMQWIHKIKIHPKMIYNRPPLNCQKCQFRFFTDQGLERHLLGSHGLVTSSMQDAANKSKDSGRCPVCGRVYQWKLLNHVARDHNMTLKPAHLSYKCTVCTATFGMYKQFENHVYSAHSVVAKRVMDKKTTSASPSAAKPTEMKPLKINDEITIIPQPAKSTNGATKEGSPAPKNTPGTSKNEDEPSSISRAERLARRNASVTDSD